TALLFQSAGRHFNRGQRGFFLAIGYLGWFAGPYVLMVSTAAVVAVLWRRQFASPSPEAVEEGGAASRAPRPALVPPRPPSPKISNPLSVTTTVSSSLMNPRLGCCSVVSTDTTMPVSSGRWAS